MDAENKARYGWQSELGKKLQRPRENELRKLAQCEVEFKAWLVRQEIPPESWDWDNETYPLWFFWNQFSEEFLVERQDDDDRQGRLEI